MALGNTDQDNPSSDQEEKSLIESTSHDQTEEEQQHILAPPGICDICAEFYHFLVSGKDYVKSSKMTNGFPYN